MKLYSKMNAKELKVKYITWEVDTTGRYLIDEICHLSASQQGRTFDEYIMPHRNITYSASRKIQLYTVSVGMYRSLRKTTNGMVMKTNTEIVTLKNFLDWLSKSGNSQVVLMCYEPYEYSPYFLLQALKRYDLLDKFKSLVYGFGDVYELIRSKCKKSVSSMSLRTLAKILLNKNNIKCLDSHYRADLVNEILVHLFEDSDNPEKDIAREMYCFVSTVDEVNMRLCTKLEKKNVQMGLKPIFVPYLKEFKNRKRALVLRNILTYKSSIDYDALAIMWSKGPEEFREEMIAQISAPQKDIDELIQLISLHFNVSETENNIKTLQLD